MPTYVHYQILSQITDVFNAGSIWQTPGFALFSRRSAIRDLLERHPREVRAGNISRCFNHVCLSLPQETLEDDEHLARGSRALELIEGLQSRHQKDFGDLLEGAEVRYQIIPDPHLAPDQIGVKFGHAVYLPGADEVLQGRLSYSVDRLIWHPLCSLHTAQRLIQLGGDAQQTSVALPHWPFGGESSVLLINDGIQFQLRPKGKLRCEFDAEQNCYVLQHERQRLFLKYDIAPSVRATTVWKARPANSPASASASVATSVATSAKPALTPSTRALSRASAPAATIGSNLSPSTVAPSSVSNSDLTYVPVSRASSRLCLVALALPRLDAYQQMGVQMLEIGFNRHLQICPAPQAEMSIRIDRQNQIQIRNTNGQQNLSLPSRFCPTEKEEMRLLPCCTPMQERYTATLSLPHPVSMAVPQGQQHLFGRGISAFAPLRVLDAPHFLQRKETNTGMNAESDAESKATSSADQLGLSRRAFRFEACKEGLRVVREAANQALFHLDEDCQWIGNVEATSTPYLIPNGHHLVAGNYVLRFDA